MDLVAMSSRVADGYDFRTKMKINVTVISELARESGMSENEVAEAISGSSIHEDIQRLADSVHSEAERLRQEGGTVPA